MDSHELLELFEGTAATRSLPPMSTTSTPTPDDISTVNNNDQMETQDVKLFIPPSISQKSQDDEQAECGTLRKINETPWMENNLESGVTVKENTEDNSCISHRQIIEDNWELTANDKQMEIMSKGNETEKSTDENSSDVNKPAMRRTKPIRRRGYNRPSKNLQLDIVKFMKAYYTEHPKARLFKLTRVMNKQLELRWDNNKLSKYVGHMIYKYQDLMIDINNGKCTMEDDREFIYERCPYFMEMDEALKLSEFYRNKFVTTKCTRDKSYGRIKPKLEVTSEDEKSQDDGKAESGIISKSNEINTERNLESTKTGKESECPDQSESPMDEDTSQNSGSDDHESNPSDLDEVYSQPSDAESSSDSVQTTKRSTRNRIFKRPLEFQHKIIKFMKDFYERKPSALQSQIQRAMNKQLKLHWTGPQLSNYIARMISSYRDIRDIMKIQKCSFEDLDEEIVSKKCPFYKELHEALQLSDYYKNRNGRRGRPRKVLVIRKRGRINSSKRSSTSVEEEIDGNAARTRVWNKSAKNHQEQVNRNTKSTEDEDHLNSEKLVEKKFIPSKEKPEERKNLIPTRTSQKWRNDRNAYELCSIAIFMKGYFKKNPRSSKSHMMKSYKEETKSQFVLPTLMKFLVRMIRTYRELRSEIDGLKSCSSSYKKKLISKRCPYFDDIHEAYQYSDFYRTSKGNSDERPGSYNRFLNQFKSSTSSTSKSSKDNKNKKSQEYLQVKIEPIECGKEQAVKNRTKETPQSSRKQETAQMSGNQEVSKTTKKPEKSKTNAKHKTNKRIKGHLDLTPEVQIMFARFMRDYYKKDPTTAQIVMLKNMRKHFELKCAVGTLGICISRMIKTYRILRHQLGNPDDYSKSLKKDLKLKRCPYFFELHDAFQYSDYYRNSNWTPNLKTWKRRTLKNNRLQPSTTNASSDDEMETTDETAVCKTSPKHVKHPSKERRKNTSINRNLESRLIEKEVMIVIPPLKMPDRKQKETDSDEVVIVTPLLKVPDCDHKQTDSDEVVIVNPQLKVPDCDHRQDTITEPVEKDKAFVKNPTVIEELKLSSEQQLELIKLEDRKEERQFQMQLTKMQQEYEIMKLKLQIKYERVKNLKQ